MSFGLCQVQDCGSPSVGGGLCWAHWKRRQRQKSLTTPLRPYGLSASEQLERAALDLGDAEGDEAYRHARARLHFYRYKRGR